jgi:ferredoxin
MPSVQEDVLIVGGGLAAQRAVETLVGRCGHGDCAAIAPGVFRVDEVAVVIGDGPDALVLEAARACPAMAIEVVDADTGALVECGATCTGARVET